MRVLTVTGASGGHIYPALAFLERFALEKGENIALLVLPSRSIKADFSSCKYPLRYISSGRVRFSFDRKSILALLNFLKGGLESFSILLKFRPDIVVGFGSIDSIPLVMLAWFFRIKTIIHEQNLMPGKANRFLSRFADKVAFSYSGSGKYFGLSESKAIFTGNPIRCGLKKIGRQEALNFFDLKKDKFTILVMGGSQGSERINATILEAAGMIKNKEDLQVIHLFGKQDYSAAVGAYEKLGIKARAYGFFEKMEFAYSAADLTITRAGATTISELIYYKLPAIISPYPYAYKHQSENAKILEAAGCGVIIKDDELTAECLRRKVEDFISDSGKISAMRSSYAGIGGVNAADELVKAIFLV